MQKPQKNTLDECLLLLLSLSALLFISVGFSLLGHLIFSVDEDDLTILGDNDLTTLGILSSWK